MAELTSTGLTIRTIDEIVDEIHAELRTKISPELNLETSSPLGQIVGVLARPIRLAEELALAVYSSQYPASANGFSLTNVAALTGTARDPATHSYVLCNVNVDPGTYAIGDLVAHVVGDPNARFANSVAVVNGGGSAATITGVRFEAIDTGPIRANAGTLSVIADPVSGWNSITANSLDATLGADEEADTSLRVKREAEIATFGETTTAAIRADILLVPDVLSCRVLENDTDETVDGMPPHSFEALVRNGDEDAIAAAILAAKAAGIRSHGTTIVAVTDEQGEDHEIRFTRPTGRNLYITMQLAVDAATYVGDDAIKDALVDYGDLNQAVGSDVVFTRLIRVLMEQGGVEDVPELFIGFTASPTYSLNLDVTSRQLAVYDTSRIIITTIPYVDN